MIRVIVERNFATPRTDADLAASASRQHDCMGIYRVTWRRSLLSEDRMRMICEYEAPDAESVRRVQRQAETEFDRVWTAEAIE